MQLEARLAKLVDQHATDREALARAQAAGAKEMEVLESEMARMRAEMGHALAGSQQRVQKAVMECDELTHKYAEVQARINGSVLAALDSIVSMKPRTTNQLIDLRDTVMAEVEECKNLKM
ncbi:hypothetical protein BC830DRAFT_1175525 [Chytriomyces sp. MP71]|nr:hypothetical protein BC830DRAFT_1175525 [Chytriomyces sp. MP71]